MMSAVIIAVAVLTSLVINHSERLRWLEDWAHRCEQIRRAEHWDRS